MLLADGVKSVCNGGGIGGGIHFINYAFIILI
jgi:hypothetical protein